MGNILSQFHTVNHNNNNSIALIDGYIKIIEKEYKIKCPNSMKQMIHEYYIKYQIFGIGHNRYGTFGVGHLQNLNKFTLLKEMEAMTININNIYWDHDAFYIKTIQNEIFVAGDKNTNNLHRTEFMKVEINSDYTPKFLTRGTGRTYIYTTKNDIYPINNAIYPGANEEIIHDMIGVIDIQYGVLYSLLLTNQCKVLITGFNSDGRLSKLCGLSNYKINENIHEPKQVKIPNNGKIISISVSIHHTLMINEDHELIVFGENDKGQLGMDKEERYIFNAINHPYFEKHNIKINQIDTSWYYSMVISSNYHCYLFGENKYGNIGNGTENNMIYGPYKLNEVSPNKFIDGSCGVNHTLLLTMNHEIVSFGSNEFYQCSSIMDNENISSPNIINKSKEMHIAKNCFIEKVLALANKSVIITNPSKKCHL